MKKVELVNTIFKGVKRGTITPISEELEQGLKAFISSRISNHGRKGYQFDIEQGGRLAQLDPISYNVKAYIINKFSL